MRLEDHLADKGVKDFKWSSLIDSHAAPQRRRNGATATDACSDNNSSLESLPIAPAYTSVVSSLTRDSFGRLEKKVCTRSDGRVTTEVDDPNGRLVELVIQDKDCTTTIRKALDPYSELYLGQRLNNKTHVVDDVVFRQKFLVYLDRKTKAIEEAESLQYKFNDANSVPSYTRGSLDADRGFFSYRPAKDFAYRQYLAPGRFDVLTRNGVDFHSSTSSESGCISPSSAVVQNADGSMASSADGQTVTMRAASGKIETEPFSAAETDFLDKHKQTDLRDMLKIHQRLRQNPDELYRFYSQLSRLDAARNLSQSQISALQDNLLHEVAYPDEIYQGTMGSCNVTTVEREMALDTPALLVGRVDEAADQGQLAGTSGRVYSIDRAQLLRRDLSGRDMASRIFQSAAIDIEEQRNGMHFRNTMDGVGRTIGRMGVPLKFNGLSLPQIADVALELAGGTHSVVRITSADDLARAYLNQKGRSLIAEVDASMPPFTTAPQGKMRAGHVVNIVGMEQVPALSPLERNNSLTRERIAFENQWGLLNDHSAPNTMVDAAPMLQSMRMGSKPDGTRYDRGYGLVILRGLKQNVQYKFEDGELTPL